MICCEESATAMIHSCPGSYQNTFGSRKFAGSIEGSFNGLITGFLAYGVQVRPRSVLKAISSAWVPDGMTEPSFGSVLAAK